MRNFTYLRTGKLDAMARTLARDPAIRPLAGGTDLLDLMKSGIATPERVMDIKSAEDGELRVLDRKGDRLRVGALVTLREIAASPLLRRECAVLAEAAAAAASPQLRNVGTLGGNLCQRPRCWYFRDPDFPCLRKDGDECFAAEGRNRFHAVVGGDGCHIVHPSDLAVALVALDATVVLRREGDRRRVPVREFFVLPEDDVTRETVLKPGELVTGVEIPRGADGVRSGYTKFAFRDSWDFAVVSVAVVAEVDGGTLRKGDLALGGVAPVPWHASAASALLPGVTGDGAALEKVVAKVLDGAEPLAENGYKVPLARNLVRRAVRELLA
jgi:xanthine dehydrogenase YagS FAD-binding subunit